MNFLTHIIWNPGARLAPLLSTGNRQSATGNRPGLAALLLLASMVSPAWGQSSNNIVNTLHNLSVSSRGTVHASQEQDVCIFCHAPHHATSDGPLWNHQMSVASYNPYPKTSYVVFGQPNGSSRLCLSCHDGTVALGAVSSRSATIAMNGVLPSASSLGTDLSKHHPVSFVYDAALAASDTALNAPSTLPPEIQLDQSSQMQCTSCHDPHNDQYGNFLVVNPNAVNLCNECHNSAVTMWSASMHALSAKPVPAALASVMASGNAPAPAKVRAVQTVAAAGCGSCHVSHGAGGKQLVRFAAPEQNCALCHASQGPGQNVMPEFNKASVHPIYQNSLAHADDENVVDPPQRHATCVDCHNPHAVNQAAGSASSVAGALTAVKGVTAGGAVVRNVQHEYELCFRCHGDSAQRGPASVPRQFVETNTRRQFNPGNGSFHPLEALGNGSTTSLLPAWKTAGLIRCTDCHNSDQSPAAGGSGPNGPHGSAYAPLLERMLLLTDGQPYNPNNSALCYKCHNSLIVDSSQYTSWANHQTHLENYRAVCTTCHDSHGTTQKHLVNFNTTYVQPFNGVLSYLSTGPNHGTCTLTCHDGNGHPVAHNAKAY